MGVLLLFGVIFSKVLLFYCFWILSSIAWTYLITQRTVKRFYLFKVMRSFSKTVMRFILARCVAIDAFSTFPIQASRRFFVEGLELELVKLLSID